MNNKIFFFLFCLGIFSCFSLKYYNIKENLECDPNKPKKYKNNHSSEECKLEAKRKVDKDIKNFERELGRLENILKNKQKELNVTEQKIKTNYSNIKKLIKSLKGEADDKGDDGGEDKGSEETGEFDRKAKNTKKTEKRKAKKYNPSSRPTF